MAGKGRSRRRLLKALAILRKESSDLHPMSATQLAKRLAKAGYAADRNTVHDDLVAMRETYPENVCEYATRERASGTGEMQDVVTGWYWLGDPPPLEPREARYLSDCVMAARDFAPEQRKALAERVLGSAEGMDLKLAENALPVPSLDGRTGQSMNPSFALVVDVLANCIGEERLVAFRRGEVDEAGRVVPVGSRVHVVAPYHLVLSGGSYYLLGMYPGTAELRHFRVDLIYEASEYRNAAGELVAVTPLREVNGFRSFNLQKFLDEHLLMFGDPVPIRLRVRNGGPARLYLFEQFGSSAAVLSRTSEWLECRVKANPDAMAIWARQFAGMVEVLEPQAVRDRLATDAAALLEMYRR